MIILEDEKYENEYRNLLSKNTNLQTTEPMLLDAMSYLEEENAKINKIIGNLEKDNQEILGRVNKGRKYDLFC